MRAGSSSQRQHCPSAHFIHLPQSLVVSDDDDKHIYRYFPATSTGRAPSLVVESSRLGTLWRLETFASALGNLVKCLIDVSNLTKQTGCHSL